MDFDCKQIEGQNELLRVSMLEEVLLKKIIKKVLTVTQQIGEQSVKKD
jgi:hypothetical protein